jgi:hypothetical protein
MDVMKLCTPALVYFVIGVISLVIAFFQRFLLSSLLIKGFFILVWTWLLNLLCQKGYKTISWILVILPYIMMFGVFAMALELLNKSAKAIVSSQQGPAVTKSAYESFTML